MRKGRTFSLIVPCYNEVEGIKKILGLVPSFIDEVIVVDSSSDDTGEIARGMGAKLIIEERRGYGRAYKTGFEHAKGDIIITMDADGTYPVAESELLPLVDTFIDENIDFLNTSRFPIKFDPAAMSPIRIIGNAMMTAAGNFIFNTKLRDYLSGMWVFKRSILHKFRLDSDAWSLSEEIKLEAIINGFKFKEVHIPYRIRIGTASLVDFAINQYKVGLWNLLYFLRKRFFRRWTPFFNLFKRPQYLK
jgi:dolichol-phosphate hexosyltransferase